MRISNGALCNTHRAHVAQIKLVHIDLNKREQSYIGILLAELANSWGSFSDFLLSSKNSLNFFQLSDHKTNIFFYSF